MMVELQEKTINCEKLKEPCMYCCVIHNDDITTMDFVVMALIEVFALTAYEATQLMMNVHNNGKAKIGRYCYDIALTKKIAMDTLAKANSFPLATTVEEA